MKKIIYLILLLFPFYIYALDYPKLNSKNGIVYNLTEDRVLYEKNSSDKTSIASLTKIATTITAIENIDDLDEEIIITKDMLKDIDPALSLAGLKPGDKVTYRDLLYATILPSGADATIALAIASTGSEENFVNKMNDLVNNIGLTNTHFANVHGLDNPEHYSTPEDVLKLLKYSLDNPLFRQIYTTKQYTLSNGLKVKSSLNLYNTTKVDTSKILGSKTGFTLNAGYCLSSLDNIKGYEIIIITINAEGKNNKYYNIIDTSELIDFIDDNYIDYTIVDKDKTITKIPVKLSKTNEIIITSHNKVNSLLPIDYDRKKIKIEYDGLKELNFLNKKGDKIGTINYYYEDKLIEQEDIILNTTIKLSIEKVIASYFYIFIILVIILFIVINKDIIFTLIKKD